MAIPIIIFCLLLFFVVCFGTNDGAFQFIVLIVVYISIGALVEEIKRRRRIKEANEMVRQKEEQLRRQGLLPPDNDQKDKSNLNR